MTLELFDKPKRFSPARHGEPWPIMCRLCKLGLLRVERRHDDQWRGDIGGWEISMQPVFLAHTTQAGKDALAVYEQRARALRPRRLRRGRAPLIRR